MSYNKNNYDQTNGKPYLSVPPRWLKCPRRGSLIANKFIPFKTPLDERYESQIPASDLFTPQMFISLVATYKVKLGLWVDLTFTTRFYEKSFVEEKKIKYVKFQCKGHDECPTTEQTKLFIDICDKYIAMNPLDVIAVHCTHGFNRTGFLICCFLVEKCDWSVEAAVDAFAKARQPGIYKEEYIRELFARYGDAEDAPPAPPMPQWCQEFDDEDDEGNKVDHNSTHSNRLFDSRKRKPFMEGVKGVKDVTNPSQIQTIQQMCQKMCKFQKKGFPGSQPVSMDNKNVQFISDNEYMVSWKADGNRYMMLIMRANDIYFIDRDNSVFKVEGITFLNRKTSKHLENTLLDGEMILDVVNGTKVPRYLIYDIITFETKEVGGTDFRTRLLCIDKEIVGPREKAKMEGTIDRSREPFGIRKKDFWEVKDTYKIFGDNFKRNLSHEIDGLVFQPVSDPYIAGRCDVVLKWKPPSHNSVDFRLKIIREERPGMLRTLIGNLYVGGHNPPFGSMKVNKDLKQYDNKIIECTFDMTTNQWVFMRERTDKSYPNSYDTAVAVCNSIKYPITKDILLNYIGTKGWTTRIPKRPHSTGPDNNGGTDRNLMPPPVKAPRKS